MIKNDRQYRVTKAQLRAFKESLRALPTAPIPEGIAPALLEAQRQALESQREELQEEVIEYEALREGKVSSFIIENLEDLPNVLIKARISLKLTQKDLADILHVKEQQVQKWEANDYAGASMETLKQVLKALGLQTKEEVFIPNDQVTPDSFLGNLANLGISQDLLLKRLLPDNISAALESKSDFKGILQAAGIITRIFGVTIRDLFSAQEHSLPIPSLATTRFKLPSRTKREVVNAYTIYAHYIASLAESCTINQVESDFPSDYHQVYEDLTTPGEPMSFAKALKLFWNAGVIIVPLCDSGAFHGATWKIRGRSVVVLKQNTPLESRWLFDLLHEMGHVALGHVSDDFAIIEEEPISLGMHGTEEEEVNGWAEEVLFDGDSDEIEQACVQACSAKIQRLRAALPEVAKRFNVNMGALANHMAFRMSSEGQDWWGTAQNLQVGRTDPFITARETLLRRINLKKLNPVDRDLLLRALTKG